MFENSSRHFFSLDNLALRFTLKCKEPRIAKTILKEEKKGKTWKFSVSSVQSLSSVQIPATPWITARQASLSITDSQSSLRLIHWVSDAIQPSQPLLSPSPPALNLSQHQGLFRWVNSASGGQSIGVSASTSVLPKNTQDWSPLGWTSWISLQSKGLSRVFSNTTVQKHQFFCAQFSL